MRKLIIVLLSFIIVFSGVNVSYASDWDKAGKAFAIIEGLRVITGGKVDVIGKVTGIDNDKGYEHAHRPRRHRHKKQRRPRYEECHKKWIPHFKWKKKYIPEQEEYDPEYGKIIVEGHYIRYKVEKGGHWEEYCS